MTEPYNEIQGAPESNNESQGVTESNQSKRARYWNIFCFCMITIVGVIVTVGIIIICLYYQFTAKRGPYSTIEKFDVFALNKAGNTTNTTNSRTIDYELMFYVRNRKYDYGTYYDALNLTFYYKPSNNLLLPIGNATFPPFYKGKYDRVGHFGRIVPTGAFWENATKAVSENGSAVFRVELVTGYRYKVWGSKGTRHRMVVGGNLRVNDQGKLVKSKIFHLGVELTSGARRSKGSFGLWGILGALIWVSFML